ncbi:hypothetical protein CBER1_00136 [Cercospora berteroae]|uniref:ATP-grasp domain-containing protein n=1 Tax=Cercospora berteroae TaxID=357750 RepID=A0A2S6CDM1_9PEZI|nr:hypothetical protein CBER1_00136 [Cercospora berteroae]
MVLNAQSPWSYHAAQNISLILLSLVFLPLDITILVISYAIRFLSGRDEVSKRGTRTTQQSSNSDETRQTRSKKTILVTGVGMTKGLVLARAFHQAGHTVIGADFEPGYACGRFSASLNKFHTLRKPSSKSSGPYVQSLLDVILKEKVNLWVSCSGVASAVEDGEAKEIVESRTKCKAVQFDVATTTMLHEKDKFIARTEELGLTIPETKTITKRSQVEEALQNAPKGRKYIMKTIGMDDKARGDIMTLLPKEGGHSETSKYLDRLRISQQEPWILQQFIQGEEFCTHALVINGRVRAFVACPSAELLMHYRALPSDSALSKAMLRFTERYAAAGGEGFTGHLSFDFLVGDTNEKDAEKILLYPIECNPRAHTAVGLFNRAEDMVHGYLELLDGVSKKDGPEWFASPVRNDAYYWIGHDLVTLVLVPLMEVLSLQLGVREIIRDVATFVVHLLTWKDGTYELWDPLPWFMLYHVYWPMQFLNCLREGRTWSRINVSTTKMFEC